MTSKQRAYLKSLANNLTPIFQVGKSSLTPEFTKGIEEAFNLCLDVNRLMVRIR